MRHWLFSLLLGIGTATHASSLIDLLDLPAQPAARALGSLTLDVTRAGERLVTVGEYGNILYSDDEGASWRQAQVPVQITLTSVHFSSPEQGWAVGHDAVILHSEDAGTTWQRQLDGRQTGEILVAGAERWEANVAALEGTEGVDTDELMLLQDAVMMAMDEAQRELEIGPNRPFMDVLFTDDQNGFAVGAFNYFFVTSDGGQTWTDGSSRLPNPEFLHLYSISPVAENTLLVVGEFGMVMRSKDAGTTWEQLDLGYDGTLFSVTGDAGEVWVAGLRGNIFYSPDVGDTWQHLERQTEASFLGAYITGKGRASFVGLGGTQQAVDLSGDKPSVKLAKAASATLAALTGVSDNGLVIVGQAGIARVDDNGRALAVRYIESEN